MRRGAVGKDEDMEAYSSFAEVYDIFQDNVPYEEWCSYVTGLLRHGKPYRASGRGRV